MRKTFVAGLAWLLTSASIAVAQTPEARPVTDETGRFSVSAEALVWWFKSAPAPPLVTDGLLSNPGTTVLLGGQDLDTNPNPGFKLTAGYSFTERWGAEGSFFSCLRAARAGPSAPQARAARKICSFLSSMQPSPARA